MREDSAELTSVLPAEISARDLSRALDGFVAAVGADQYGFNDHAYRRSNRQAGHLAAGDARVENNVS